MRRLITFILAFTAIVVLSCPAQFVGGKGIAGGNVIFGGGGAVATGTAPTLSGTPPTCEAGSASCTGNVTVATSSDSVYCGGSGIGGSTFTCSCTSGTFHALDSAGDGAGDTAGQGYLTGCATGTTTITASSTGAAATSASFYACTGGSPACTIDGTAHGMSAFSTSTTQNSPSVTPTQPDLCPSVYTDAGGGGAGANPAVAGGFTLRGTPSLIFPTAIADKTTSAAAQAQWTPTSAPLHGTAMVACFK